MTVLDGDTSQWNRSAIDRRAIGPAAGSPARDPLDRLEVRPDRRRVGSGANAARRRSSRAIRAPRKRQRPAEQHDPTLRHSPRSTRGTTRTIAYWNGLRGSSGTLRLLDELARRLEPRPR